MAAPYNARYRIYAPNKPIWTDGLNAIQDRLIDLFADHDLVSVEAVSAWDAANSRPAWVVQVANPEFGFENLGGLGDGALFFHLHARQSFEIHALKVKYYNAHPSADLAVDLQLHEVNSEFSSDLAVPSLGSPLVDLSGGTAIAHGVWGVRSSTGLTIQVITGRRLIVIVTPGATGDRCAGLDLTVRPLTASS